MPLTSNSAVIGALERQVNTLGPMRRHDLFVGGLEGTVLTRIVSFSALTFHMELHLVFGNGLLTVEGTLGVHILAVVLVRVQVRVQLVQCPRPLTASLLHAAVHLEALHTLLVLDLLINMKSFLPTSWARGVTSMGIYLYTVQAVALSTAAGEGQSSSHLGALGAEEVIWN